MTSDFNRKLKIIQSRYGRLSSSFMVESV